MTNTLRGIATVNIYAADHEAAKAWYSQLLGIEPYFQVPGYAEFRIGDFENELGIVDAAFRPAGESDQPGGAQVFWHVDDLEAMLARLIELSATPAQPIIDRGHGFVTATVIDPFGNILGVMSNPHYLEIVER